MRVLLSAASRHGATTEILDALARVLLDHGVDIDTRAPDDVADLAGYDAVVLGSAVYMGRWLEAARTFVAEHHDALAARPVWLFSSGPVGEPPVPAHPPEEAVVYARDLGARDHRVFPGRLTREALGPAERMVAKLVRTHFGDFRPWPEIECWAKDIAAGLSESAVD